MILKRILCSVLILITIFSLIPVNSHANSAQSAIVMEVKTGRILYARNINSKMPMASTTKIMTALLALENRDLDSMVKAPKEAVGVEGSSIYLKNDERISLRDLVYGLMLRSGNDSAVAIAHHVSGSVNEFSKLMNERAKKLELQTRTLQIPMDCIIGIIIPLPMI